MKSIKEVATFSLCGLCVLSGQAFAGGKRVWTDVELCQSVEGNTIKMSYITGVTVPLSELSETTPAVKTDKGITASVKGRVFKAQDIERIQAVYQVSGPIAGNNFAPVSLNIPVESTAISKVGKCDTKSDEGGYVLTLAVME